MYIESVTVGSAVFNVVQASAVDQKSLLMLLGGKIAMHSAAGKVEEINTVMLKGALLTLPEDTLDKVAGIVLYKTVMNGSDQLVTVENFQGNINDYFTLIAEAVKVNLQDFFTWLDSENKAVRDQVTKSKLEAMSGNQAL
jgi:hypothetical protein